MIDHLFKLLFVITTICLLAIAPAYSSEQVIHTNKDLHFKYPVLLESIYQGHQGKQFWQEDTLRDEFEKQIVVLVTAGISHDLIEEYQALTSAAKDHDWQRYDRLASDALLFYIAYTEQINRKGTLWLFGGKISNNIGLPSKKSIDSFFNALSAQDRLEYLQTLLPASTRHSGLYQSFLSYHLTPDNPDSVKFNTSAKPGEKLQQKEELLARLQISGDISVEMKRHIETQDKELYSEELQEVIRAFQVRHGLEVDAVIGKNTRYWLNISPNERLRLMALNILRVQLWGINKPRLVLVNIPNYTMEYWQEGVKKFASKVIVGRVKRKTPLFTTKLDSIVFNPSWYVPQSIMRKDIIPKALADKDYFKQNHYEIMSNWQSKQVINADEIEWPLITAKNFPYKLRQKPGEKNALGLYKFNTPNEYAIYLHDTPAKQLFDKQDRAYSSGCVRVQNADKFAQLLMNQSGFSENDFLNYQQQEKTTTLRLKKEITLFTIYQTVWVDELGVTQFRKDIYGYDKAH